MDDLIKQLYAVFSDLIGSGMYIMPPDKNFLFYEEYDFSNLQVHRDAKLNHIGQLDGKAEILTPDKYYPDPQKLDFADSAHKTGFLAFCNSITDQQYLPIYENGSGIMVRYPFQAPANNWKTCTRDQLLAYSAGCWRANREDIVQRLLGEADKRSNIIGFPLCQNSEENKPGTTKNFWETDILDPSHVMFLKICSGDNDAYKDPIAQLVLQVAIEVTSKNIDFEKNQLILQAIVCGRLDLYVHIHDNYKENIRYYWGGWRRQAEIGEALIRVIEIELKRYSGQMQPFSLGLPIETLTIISSSLEAFEKFVKGDFPAVQEFVKKFFHALDNDAQKIAREIDLYIKNAFKNPLNILNIPFMPYNPIAKLLNNLFNGTDLSEVYARLNEIQKSISELKKLSEKILEEIADIPDEVKKKLYISEVNITIKTFSDYANAYGILVNKKGVDVAVAAFSSDLDSLIKDFLNSIHKYFEFETKYIALPFVVNIMDMHLSCITMAKKNPALIISVIDNYKLWIKQVVDDRADDSLFKKIENSQDELRSKVLYVKSLYNLTFTLNDQYLMDDIGKKHDPMNPVSYGISGLLKKYDYIIHEVIDLGKDQNLQSMVEQGIVQQDCFPKIVEKKLLAEEPFRLDGTYGEKPAELKTVIVSEQAELNLTFNAHRIWYFSNRTLDVESQPFPLLNNADYVDACGKLKTLGENVVNLGMLMYLGQTSLTRIDEIVKTSYDLLDKT